MPPFKTVEHIQAVDSLAYGVSQADVEAIQDRSLPQYLLYLIGKPAVDLLVEVLRQVIGHAGEVLNDVGQGCFFIQDGTRQLQGDGPSLGFPCQDIQFGLFAIVGEQPARVLNTETQVVAVELLYQTVDLEAGEIEPGFFPGTDYKVGRSGSQVKDFFHDIVNMTIAHPMIVFHDDDDRFTLPGQGRRQGPDHRIYGHVDKFLFGKFFQRPHLCSRITQ